MSPPRSPDAPDPDVDTIGRVEVSRRTDGLYRVFVGNSYGTCGSSDVLDAESVPAWLEDALSRVLAAEVMGR